MTLGTRNNPLSMNQAFADNSYIKAGAWIWLKGIKTLTAPLTINIIGRSEIPTIIESAPHCWGGFDLNGHDLTINGADLLIRDIEIFNSAWDTAQGRRSFTANSNPNDLTGRAKLDTFGDRIKFHGCFIHDLENNGWWSPVDGYSEFVDCVLWNNGWIDAVNAIPFGHNWYWQQNTLGANRLIDNCISSISYGMLAIGGSQAHHANGGTVRNSIILNACRLGRGTSPLTDMLFENNIAYFKSPLEIEDASNCIFQNNRFISLSSIELESPESLSFQNNTLIRYANRHFVHSELVSGANTIDNNQYYSKIVNSDNWGGVAMTYAGQTITNLGDWQAATGYDANSIAETSAPDDLITIKPARSGSKRIVATIAIENHSEQDTVALDVSGVCQSGQSYRLRSAYNPMIDFYDFVYQGENLVIAMSNRFSAVPIGASQAILAPDKRFMALSLERLS